MYLVHTYSVAQPLFQNQVLSRRKNGRLTPEKPFVPEIGKGVLYIYVTLYALKSQGRTQLPLHKEVPLTKPAIELLGEFPSKRITGQHRIKEEEQGNGTGAITNHFCEKVFFLLFRFLFVVSFVNAISNH